MYPVRRRPGRLGQADAHKSDGAHAAHANAAAPNEGSRSGPPPDYYYYYYFYTLFLPRGKVRPADNLQLKAAIILPLLGLARSKQDPIKRGHPTRLLCENPTL